MIFKKFPYRLQTILYLIIDLKGILVSTNPIGAFCLGYRIKTDLVGYPVSNLFHYEYHERLKLDSIECIKNPNNKIERKSFLCCRDEKLVLVKTTIQVLITNKVKPDILLICEPISDLNLSNMYWQDRKTHSEYIAAFSNILAS